METESDVEVGLWDAELDSLLLRVGERFSRVEPRRRMRDYVRGLLGPVGRKNSWQIAEHAGHDTPYGLQRLLSWCQWDPDEIRDDLQDYVAERLGQPDGVLIVDDTGFLKKGTVSAASVQDSIAGQTLIEKVAVEHPSVRKTWVDGGYRQHLVEHAATLGIDMHIVRRDPATRGFTVLSRRWTVERTLGWLMNHRRLARDYEAHPHRSEAMIHLAMINLMTRRLTAESAPT